MKLVKLLLSSLAAVVVTLAVTGCANAQRKADCACPPEGGAAKASEHPSGGEHPAGTEHPSGGEHPSSTPPAAEPAPAPKLE